MATKGRKTNVDPRRVKIDKAVRKSTSPAIGITMKDNKKESKIEEEPIHEARDLNTFLMD
jgi:hypothetical protein